LNRILLLLKDRNFILILALIMGLIWENGAIWTEPSILPALAVVMTLSVLNIPAGAFSSLKTIAGPGLAGVAMSFLVNAMFIIGLSSLLIHDKAIWAGFVIIAAMPPAVAVIPFAGFLNGNSNYALFGTVGAYLAALVLTPLIALLFLGTNFISPLKLFIIIIKLIVAPVVVAQILARTGIARFIEPVKGAVTNWSFFLITYTIVGLNKQYFVSHPLSLMPAAAVAAAGTFVLGWIIGKSANRFGIDRSKTVSLILLGTLKNYGLSGGLALTFFDRRTALPSTVSVVFMVIYIIRLEFRKRQGDGK
jgi:bile acid:Na+ symporter, BASS family